MDLHQARFALLKLAVLVLAGTSWLFSGFIFESRPEENLLSADPLTSLVRLPASLPAQLPENVFGPQEKPKEPVRMDTVKLPCWDRNGIPEQKIASRWIRLIGRACQNDVAADGVSVRNLTNGYMGTVFASSESSYTTDFIPLESGKNEVLIRFQPEPGISHETRVTFYR